ncbi:MAG: helix-turn-helix transcriptional regulator [Eubacteriaceae bacterium]|nr:helix-turn-helix transcriptional regulator [Eubacteriaceae bacterium]
MSQAQIIMAVQKMQEYIEDHIGDEITLKQLSCACAYSPWHAARIFKDVTGKTPFEYIRALRLSKAAISLRDEDSRIIDVALDFVFDSHEGFTRAFSKQFGIAPKKYSDTTPPVQLFMPYKVYDTYKILNRGEYKMSEEKKTKTIFVQVIQRPERKVLIKRGITAEEYFKYCEEVGCDIWALLTSVKEALYEPVGMWLPKHLIKEGTSRYIQGVELPLDYSNSVPEGYELIDLPPCNMMVFQGEPYNDDDFMDAIKEVESHIDAFDPSVYGYEWDDEGATRFQLAPMGYRGYIEARAVKAIK